jgi:hypothetical protein
VPIVPQHATATADGDGDAVFAFPQVPQGELWCGTTQIPDAPSSATGMVTSSGELLGSVFGPGSYGPWTCGATRNLVISMSGLTPGTQYEAIWHADSEGASTSTYPAPIVPTVVAAGGTVIVANFPAIQEVDGTVTAEQGSPPWEVVAEPSLAGSVESGQVTMNGAAVPLPSHAAVQGVVLSSPATNAAVIAIGAPGVTAGTGYQLTPGMTSPILPVANSDELAGIGTASDVLSFLVI